MVDDDDVDAASAAEDDLIDRLYEVAVDPSRYEVLLDHWEQMIAPRRAAANKDQSPVLRLEPFEGHFRRADQVLNNVLAGASAAANDPVTLLRKVGRTAAFIVDRGLMVSFVNVAAALSLGVAQGAALSEIALGPGEAEILTRQIGSMLMSNSPQPAVVRVRSERVERMILMHLRVIRPESEPAFVIALASELSWPAGFTDMMRTAFGLTQAEGEVMRALAEGSSLAEIAERRHRSLETVRAQLKALMSKTETRSQTELVRLTLSTMEMAQSSEDEVQGVLTSSDGFGALVPRPFQTMSPARGRQMDFLTLGAQNGRPLLFLPLDYGLVRWPATAEAEAERRGIKIVVPVRPGYGNSTPLPKGTAYISQIVDDLVALLDHLGMDQVPVISMGGDVFFAVALHAAYPERVRAVIAAAGLLPLTRPEQYERMEKWHRFILAGARYTPHLLPFMVKAGFALAHRLGKRGFVHAVYGNSEADVATFETPEVFEAMVCGSDVCLSESHSAHDAFAREVIAHETSDWTEEFIALRLAQERGSVAVHYLNGMQDPQVPLKTLEDHRRDYPWIDFRVYPDAGQLIFFRKWRDILNLAERYL